MEQYQAGTTVANRVQTDCFFELKRGSFAYQGLMDKAIRFIVEKQMKDVRLWEKFVNQFRILRDGEDEGWRGEYWGKLMMGACTVYAYAPEEALYSVLRETTEALIATQDSEGRISSYAKSTEFVGWDMWGRKYVLLGLLCFYDICKEQALREKILSASCAHADYILKHIGDGERQTPLTATSCRLGGLNSCSSLEAFVKLYNVTNEKRYFDFCEYIVGTGGCSNGDLFAEALEGVKKPFEYSQTKAYELTSFFEGVLECYRVNKDERYFNAVKNYVDLLADSDRSIIGCCGCNEEHFDNATKTQTEFHHLMQETCVTVAWIKICYQMLCITGEERYAGYIEESAYNALYASVNYNGNVDEFIPDPVDRIALPFDSYNPLVHNRRGIVPGGYRLLEDNTYYGCCASYGAVGLGIIPAISVMRFDGGLAFNIYEQGEIRTEQNGTEIIVRTATQYPQGESVKMTLSMKKEQAFCIKFRIPEWMQEVKLTVNGTAIESQTACGYIPVERIWQEGDTVALTYRPRITAYTLNGKTAIKKGAFVFARDERYGEDIEKAVKLGEGLSYTDSHTADFPVNAEIEIKSHDGAYIHMCDYASAGKDWRDGKNRVTVWME